MSEDELRARHEKGAARRQQAILVAEERKIWALRQWEEKEKALSETWALRQERQQAKRQQSREKSRRKDEARQQYKEMELRRQEELFEAAKAIEKKTEDQVARVAALNQEVADLMSSAAAVRAAVLDNNRQQIEQREHEYKQKKRERAEKAHAQAFEHRQRVLDQKRTQPQLRATREIGQRQAARMERIREMEREEKRERLEVDLIPEPPSLIWNYRLSKPAYLEVEAPRSVSPPRVRPQSAGAYRTEQPGLSSALPTSSPRVRPQSAGPFRPTQ